MSKGALTRSTILDEAVEIASRVGFGGLSIGQLADQVDMSKSGLFAHFRSKEQLQIELLDRVLALVIADVIHMRAEMLNYASGRNAVLRILGNTSAMAQFLPSDVAQFPDAAWWIRGMQQQCWGCSRVFERTCGCRVERLPCNRNRKPESGAQAALWRRFEHDDLTGHLIPFHDFRADDLA